MECRRRIPAATRSPARPAPQASPACGRCAEEAPSWFTRSARPRATPAHASPSVASALRRVDALQSDAERNDLIGLHVLVRLAAAGLADRAARERGVESRAAYIYRIESRIRQI